MRLPENEKRDLSVCRHISYAKEAEKKYLYDKQFFIRFMFGSLAENSYAQAPRCLSGLKSVKHKEQRKKAKK